MVDTVTTTMGKESMSSTANDDDNQNSSNINLIKSNKPIRILKRPTSQSQLPVTNNIIPTTTIVSNNLNNNNSPFSNTILSSTIVPVVSIIPRNQTKDSINSSEITNSSISLSSQSTKPAIKTYEQREHEYRLARLRIMGEEESSTKDDDENPTIESTSITSDEPIKTTLTVTITSSTTNKTSDTSQSSLQSHSTAGSYASNLFTLNNTSLNTGAIHFTPTTNSTGPFSQQQYHGAYYPEMSLAPPPRYLTNTFYIPSAIPSLNTWYHYQQQQTSYGTQQYTHPQ